MQNPNEKDINGKIYFQGLQIKNAVEKLKFNCHSLYEKDNLVIMSFINDLYVHCSTKLKVILGNNLALTLFPEYATSLLQDFIKQSHSLINLESKFTLAILRILCNSTDCSKNVVKRLLEVSYFKKYISLIITDTSLSDENGYNIVLSAINIVNNVVRREPYRYSFNEYYFSDRIFEILKMEKVNENYKLSLTFMICFIFPLKNKISLEDLMNTFKENVLIYFDGVSNADDFRYQNFSSIELLEMIKVSCCNNKDLKKFYSSNLTIKMSLMRFLNRNHQINLVMSIISMLYDKNTIQDLKTLYVLKNENPNAIIVEYFDFSIINFY